jgi:hypothetical protein
MGVRIILLKCRFIQLLKQQKCNEVDNVTAQLVKLSEQEWFAAIVKTIELTNVRGKFGVTVIKCFISGWFVVVVPSSTRINPF